MLTSGHAQKKASRATCLAYSSVIFTRASGPGGRARAQFGDGGRGCGLSEDVCARATGGAPAASTEAAASVVPPSRMLRRSSARFVLVMTCSIELNIAARVLPEWWRGRAIAGSSTSLSSDLLHVRQDPGLFKKFLLRCVGTEHQLETARRIGRYPVGLLPGRWSRAEENVDRAVGILLHVGNLRGAARARHVPDQRMRSPVVGGDRPVLLDRGIRRHAQTIGLAAVVGIAVLVPDRDQVELAGAEAF